MRTLPVSLCTGGKVALVVGHSAAAIAKTELLRQAGITVRLLAPEAPPVLALPDGVALLRQPFQAACMEGCTLVICDGADPGLTNAVTLAARQMRVLVNVIDRPDACDFTMPAIVRRDDVTVAISTGGAAPVLARQLRGQIEALLPPQLGQLARAAGLLRHKVKARLPVLRSRRRFWEWVFMGAPADAAIAGRVTDAVMLIQDRLQAPSEPAAEAGFVSLVGAGPGDPDLLTLKALRRLQQADVVVYDRLVSQEILDLCRRDADRIHAGKQCGQHSMAQADINGLLVRLGQQGQRVVRLKGGDPFIFGRGGEEIEALVHAGIAFEVVPGITAANGCGAYAGIPLTHRDHAQSVVFATAHTANGISALDWDKLLLPQQTLVLYMGQRVLPQLVQTMRQRGLPTDLPAAIIENGTRSSQRVIDGPLHSLAERWGSDNSSAPCLIIIGRVVTLRRSCSWYGVAPSAADIFQMAAE